MSQEQFYLLVYAIVIGLGGLIGYFTAKSKPSLIAGGTSGGLLLVAFALSWWDRTVGLWTGTGVAALLVLVFAIRLAKTRKVIPSGILLGVSLWAAIWFALQALDVK